MITAFMKGTSSGRMTKKPANKVVDRNTITSCKECFGRKPLVLEWRWWGKANPL